MLMTTDNILRVNTRWIQKSDLARVLEIEKDSFDFPWSEKDYLSCLKQKNCIGMVADVDEKVVGVIIYELHSKNIHLLNLAVCPSVRRRGVGKQMVNTLKNKLSLGKGSRDRILLEIRETNVPAQLFFRKQQFRAVSIMPNYYEETEEAAYLFEHWFFPPNLLSNSVLDQQ